MYALQTRYPSRRPPPVLRLFGYPLGSGPIDFFHALDLFKMSLGLFYFYYL
ncbi:hypothetical protein Phi4:1_gp118 [Cellulophaga phage phi4:1]|uniref:Uncharacterized protein n=3 Tax=Lightbulbvirus Cba41 TaxID=1918524 RepID=A0A0S2MWL0_9CAUD|nr:hypothetical protein Phi4:1_gp118 [Cellulophaga phage phi4:1]AGO49531.1 hypothetical protein Phi4:1_gp118 [Cellulophaga phage phi4:1]ALO80127.1 hypothetical protein Phi4113_118 [Cellulophaga phage phi4:1_13]ALO80324.1 hypothetical protein Phi4118_118 [Cellulophaga phage phi4:1_18]